MISPNSEDPRILESLRESVAKALDRKRRLGQDAVVWQDGEVVRIEPDQLPERPASNVERKQTRDRAGR